MAALSPASARAVERPIVYAVVIDGLDGDRVDEGKAPFIKTLLDGRGARATYFQESRSILIAETNPNHLAMMSGAYGDESGIPGNAFALYSPLENEDSCKPTGAVDEGKRPSPTSGENANCPIAQTVFDAIRKQGNPDGLLTAAIFGKPKLGRIFAAAGADHLWAPCASGDDDDSYCGSVPTNPVSGYAVDDRSVMDEVIRSMNEGVGEAKRRPGFTFVNLHQVDSAGHATGVATGAYDEAIRLADMEIQRLVTALQERGEWGRTVLVLLSDHSMDTTLTKTNLTGAFTDAGIPEDSFVAVQNGSVDSIYLSDRTAPGRFELLKKMREAALATGRVEQALYREQNSLDGGATHTIDGAHPAWHAAGPRSPDLFVTHKPGGAFSDPSESSNPLPGNHGAPHTRDNFYAVVGGGNFVRQASLSGGRAADLDDTEQNPDQAENVDTAATVMGVLGLAEPRFSSGRFLGNALDISQLPGGGRPGGPPALKVARRGCSARVSWGAAEGVYDLQVKRGRSRYRSVLVNSRRLTRSLRLRRGVRYRLRVRRQAASGAHSGWARRSARCR